MNNIKDWLIEKTYRIKEFGVAITSGFVPDDIAEARYNVCKDCEYYGIESSGNSLMFERGCEICYCYLPAKVLFKDSNCPKDFWKKEN